MKARLGGYAIWQVRDFLFERAAAILVIGATLVWATSMQINDGTRRFIAAGGHQVVEFGNRAVAQHLTLTWFICALLAVHGISSNDRTTGRFRLIFAKPVRVLPYYAQAYLLHGVGFMLFTLAAVAALSRLVPVSGTTLQAATMILLVSYLLVGGVCFLFSAIWRFDWVSTGAVLGAEMFLASKFPHARWLDILPPFWKISDQIDVMKTMEPLSVPTLLWAAAYGVACFLLGLIILKRRPLAT